MFYQEKMLKNSIFKIKKTRKKYILEEFAIPSFEQVSLYFYNTPKLQENFHVIQDRTFKDLDLESVFCIIDKTKSKIGQQFLYSKIRNIETQVAFEKYSNSREIIIKQLIDDESFFQKVSDSLSVLKSDNLYELPLFFKKIDSIKGTRQLPVMQYMLIFMLLASLGIFINKFFMAILLFAFLTNTFLHLKGKLERQFDIHSINQLYQMSQVAKKISKIDFLTSHYKNEIPLSVNKILKTQKKYSFLFIENKVNSDILLPMWLLYELFKILFLIEPIMYIKLMKALKNLNREIKYTHEYIGDLDCLLSIAKIRMEYENSICIPEITNNNSYILARDLFHPLITPCVPNSIVIDNNSAIITGSNMSGKTTFAKSIATNILLGETLNICFAKQMKFNRCAITTSINIFDDICNLKSYFKEEVLVFKEIIVESQKEKKYLIIIDEPFKGTSLAERTSISQATLSFLAEQGNIVIVTTHDVELANTLNNFSTYHFEV